MRKLLALITLVLTILACSAQPKKILVLTECGGQHGPFTDAAIEWLRAQGQKNGFYIYDKSPRLFESEDFCKLFLNSINYSSHK